MPTFYRKSWCRIIGNVLSVYRGFDPFLLDHPLCMRLRVEVDMSKPLLGRSMRKVGFGYGVKGWYPFFVSVTLHITISRDLDGFSNEDYSGGNSVLGPSVLLVHDVEPLGDTLDVPGSHVITPTRVFGVSVTALGLPAGD